MMSSSQGLRNAYFDIITQATYVSYWERNSRLEEADI